MLLELDPLPSYLSLISRVKYRPKALRVPSTPMSPSLPLCLGPRVQIFHWNPCHVRGQLCRGIVAGCGGV